ncbi:hypothetical protein Nepgr_021388 [Nepenthes gracilis]|uniref:Pentatricopeptide repeat-containing protein n=1 Tax=Nepenthes gracilis TaxID=150966 RepID=A0AAD3SZM6_NEPGR|nr:hypothetical protein Nepgr_021388 [Nepenthes gracilis]
MRWWKMRNAKLPQIRPLGFSSMYFQKPPQPPDQKFSPTENCGLLPTSTSLSASLQHYINSDSPSRGLMIHAHILKTGFQPNTNVNIKLLILHLKSGGLVYARQLFEEMPNRTLSAYNYLINGYVGRGNIEESFDLVRQMSSSKEKPDGFTYSLILKLMNTGPSDLFLTCDVGRQVHAQILKSAIGEDLILFATLLDAYVKCRRVDYARRVFDRMLAKNVMCSTSIISGYMNEGYVEDAEEIFRKTAEKDVVIFNAMIEGYSKSIETCKKSIEMYIDMQRLNFRPTISTFASVIGACSLLTVSEIGQQVQSLLVKTEYITNIKIGSALIDMYSKCGKVDDAQRVFDYMPEKNIFSWTSMIDGYGKNGRSSKALEMFNRMQRQNPTKPNYVTFLSILSACAHAGLIDEGKYIFESMEKDYSMKPKMEHYSCMVDLLGRFGSIQMAWEFVMGMPEKPNSDVWAALLGSCRLYGEVNMANVVAEEIFKLRADSRPGAYVALSNTEAAAGRWENVGEVRELMKLRGISKATGSSWVGGYDGLECFHVGHKC